MKIVGLITEYNPFHNGHAFHLEEAKKVTGADAAVAVMSGDFVQRGEPAIIDKYSRCKMALDAGVDAIIELPVASATASAEGFAAGAVSILCSLGVNFIVYGAEDADRISDIKRIAHFLANETPDYKRELKTLLGEGLGYAAARAQAVEKVIPGAGEILNKPNNILAVEYEKAIIRFGADIETFAIARNDEGYHESGSLVREAICGKAQDYNRLDAQVSNWIDNQVSNQESLEKLLPDTTLQHLDYFVTLDDFSQLLFYKLSQLEESELLDFVGVTKGIASRITKYAKAATRANSTVAATLAKPATITELIELVSAKNIPKTAVSRALLHILLDIRKSNTNCVDHFPAMPEDCIISECGENAARVLGFRKDSDIMHELKERSKIPLVTKLADMPDAESAWKIDEKAAFVYNQIVSSKWNITIPDEYHAGVIIR